MMGLGTFAGTHTLARRKYGERRSKSHAARKKLNGRLYAQRHPSTWDSLSFMTDLVAHLEKLLE
jgi:N-formylglutamate amidohydrolase